MRKTEYTCDWCQTRMPAERANQFSVRPVFVLEKEPGGERSPESAFDQLRNVREREKRGLEADLCDSCFARLRGWIEIEGLRR